MVGARSHAVALAALLALVAFAVVTHGGTVQDAHAETDGAAMSLRVDASQQTGCPGGPIAGEVCVGLGQQFDIFVVGDEVPLTNGYDLARAWIDYDDQGLVDKKDAQLLWDCDAAAFLESHDVVDHGAAASCDFPIGSKGPGFHKGDLYSFSFTCTAGQSSSDIQILPFGDPIAGTSGALFREQGAPIVPTVSGMTVNCVPCPPQGCQTPTPLPVGGVALDGGLRPGAALEPESGGGRAGWLVAGSVAMAAALAAGAFALTHAKRRW